MVGRAPLGDSHETRNTGFRHGEGSVAVFVARDTTRRPVLERIFICRPHSSIESVSSHPRTDASTNHTKRAIRHGFD